MYKIAQFLLKKPIKKAYFKKMVDFFNFQKDEDDDQYENHSEPFVIDVPKELELTKKYIDERNSLEADKSFYRLQMARNGIGNIENKKYFSTYDKLYDRAKDEGVSHPSKLYDLTDILGSKKFRNDLDAENRFIWNYDTVKNRKELLK